MKGITPVVAIILLLLVTISMVGFAMGFFQRLFGQAGTGVEEQTSDIIQRSAQTVSILNINAAASKVTIRNTGTASIAGSAISVFVGGALAACNPALGSSVPAGTTAECDWSTGICNAGTIVKVVAPGNEDSRAC